MADTIKEIAIACGVSEQAIRGWCRRNQVAKDAKGSFAISEHTKTLIYQHYQVLPRNEVSQHAKASCESTEEALIAMLRQELESKNQQLAVKDKQIDELNARLAESNAALVLAQQTAQAAQALHAGTIRQQLTSSEAADEPEEAPTEKRQGWLHKIFSR